MEFRPSEVAAAVAIAVAGETQTVDIETATSLLIEHVKKVYSHWSTEPQKDIHMMILLLLLLLSFFPDYLPI